MKVEIWSDVVCPWCAIGRSRFRAALAGLPGRDDVVVRWRSFELDPAAPREREGDRAAHLAGKYGVSVEAARRMEERVAATAAEDGLDLRFDIARHGNTFDAHRILHLAWESGGSAVQDAVKDRFLRAAFGEGEPVGDPETLVRLAAEAGVDPGAAREVLSGGRYADAVRADQELARRHGISGVPFFVLDDRYGLSGAQPVEVLRQALERAWADAHPLTTPAPPAEGCTDGTCAV